MSIMFSPDSWQIHEGEYFVSRDFGFSNMCSGLLLKFELARNSSYATINPPRFSFGSFFLFFFKLKGEHVIIYVSFAIVTPQRWGKINKQNYFFSNCETNQTDFNIRNKKTLCILVATTFSGSGNFRDLFWWDL